MADGAATTTDRASESIHSGPMRESDGRTGVFTQKTSGDGNDVSRETRYPDGSSYETRQTRDPATGNTTLHDVERGPDGKVAREGSVTFDSGGKEIDKQGDQSLFDDDSPPSPPKPVSDESKPSGDEPPPKKDGNEKSGDDPGEKGECEDCSSTEPSIWSDLAAFGRGFVVGALAGAAITAGMIGLAAVSAPLAAAFGVGLAFAGAWGLGSLIGRAISGQVAREEAYETAGGFLGGIVGAGAMAGMLKPKPLPPEAPPPKPPISEPAPPKPIPPEAPPSKPPISEPAPPKPIPPPSAGRLENLDPNTVRFSQNSAGGNGRAGPLRESMAKNGWKGPPIDSVATSDGIVTLDNTRVAVARELGISKIPVNIHQPRDPLPASMKGRFGGARTWGEALEYRTSTQRPPLPASGTIEAPRMPE